MQVSRYDWKTREMPSECWEFESGLCLTAGQVARLKEGVLPLDMDDRWFVFYEAGRLYLHRSWTGHCMFVAELLEDSGGGHVGRVRVNGDRKQLNMEEDEAKASFTKLVRGFGDKEPNAEGRDRRLVRARNRLAEALRGLGIVAARVNASEAPLALKIAVETSEGYAALGLEDVCAPLVKGRAQVVAAWREALLAEGLEGYWAEGMAVEMIDSKRKAAKMMERNRRRRENR